MSTGWRRARYRWRSRSIAHHQTCVRIRNVCSHYTPSLQHKTRSPAHWPGFLLSQIIHNQWCRVSDQNGEVLLWTQVRYPVRGILFDVLDWRATCVLQLHFFRNSRCPVRGILAGYIRVEAAVTDPAKFPSRKLGRLGRRVSEQVCVTHLSHQSWFVVTSYRRHLVGPVTLLCKKRQRVVGGTREGKAVPYCHSSNRTTA